MANIAKMKRDRMLAFLEELKTQHNDDESIRAFNEIANHIRDKKYGLVWEEHTEQVDEMLDENIPVFCEDPERKICKNPSLPYNFIIEGDNLQALYLLEKTHRGKVDCIYIDPPYNTGAKDWKYNNDYVDSNDVYRHSKWLSMMKNRLQLAKHLLNPEDSVLICTIDEKEYLRLGCLLEELFPTANIQMISSIIAQKGVARSSSFYRVNEFIFIVQIGISKVIPLPLSEQWALGKKASAAAKGVVWSQLRRSGTNDLREDRPNLFYPIIFNKSGDKIISVGEALDISEHPKSPLEEKDDSLWLWPIKESGIEGNWQISSSEVMDRLYKGYIKIGKRKEHTIPISYLKRGSIKKIENEDVSIIGYEEQSGTVIVDASDYLREFVPGSQWNIESHDATYHGSQLLNKILGEKRFDFPKSLYAVRDVLRFFLIKKPNAIIVDFFAGSGTTMHAVNLLNKEYGGNRSCIMVTNNEVSESEAKELIKQGYKQGDNEWEAFGIAKYVTYPRTLCSIEGKDVNGNLIKGNYITNGEKEIPISEGFVSNVKYLKCDWTPRKPEEYLLSNVLCLHIKEMIELQNGYEIDGIKNVLILTKDDFNKTILDASIYVQIENIWLNQNMILNAEEMKLLTAKGFKYIPREFFGRELREAAE
ncbi:MAG: site-specific DNA-methyltransferase [Clostridia bacterium]|nr:site-specific DNA-methyltransferase [Clostridia bacterium]